MDQARRLPREDAELLSALVEAARNVPPDESNAFMIVQQAQTTMLVLTRLSHDILVSRRTLGELVQMQLLKYDIKDGTERFTVTDKGFAYYDQIPQQP
jgi:hypothetical protein